jgi:hypothetical protein
LSTHYLPSVNKYDWSTCKFKAKNAHALFNLSQQVWLKHLQIQSKKCTCIIQPQSTSMISWKKFPILDPSLLHSAALEITKETLYYIQCQHCKAMWKTWSAHSKLTQGQFPLPCKHENCFSISKDSEKSSWW